MAPPNGAARPRKSGSGNHTVRPVVPAIPLPHVKRQAAAAAAAASKAASSPASETKDDGSLTTTTTETLPPETPKATVDQANGTDTGVSITSHGSSAAPNGHGPAGDAKTSPDSKGEESSSTPTTETNMPSSSVSWGDPDEGQVTMKLSNGVGHIEESKPLQVAPEVNSTTSLPPPTVSPPTRYQLPPAFQPANSSANMPGNRAAARSSRPPIVNGRSHLHKPRPSNGGVHFGAFHDSASSSPAPPLSGGIAPPPGMSLPDGRQQYMSHSGTGYPPTMPPGLETMAGNNFEAYGRPNMTYPPPMDPYQHQYANAFSQSTPQSFHDSQSSAHPDDPAAQYQFAASTHRNGPPGFGDDMPSQNLQGRMHGGLDYPGMGQQRGHPQGPVPAGDDANGMIEHFQQQCSNGEFADCSLELRYCYQNIPPVRIPGHRIVLSRSPVLHDLLRKQGQQHNPVLVLETDNKWIRADSFYMAVQRLYGIPLLPGSPPRHSMDANGITSAGSTIERFNYAISYAAAGHLLGWFPVVRRGCEVAAQLLNLETVERAMDFALHKYQDNGPYENFEYGDGSRILLDAILGFAVSGLPSTFTLQTSVTGAQVYARLPYDTPSPGNCTAPNPESPITVRGNSISHRSKGSLSQSHPNIQFGDLSLTNGNGGGSSETPRASHQMAVSLPRVLSQVLLNLPFSYLKMLLEHGSGNVDAWSNMEIRLRIIGEVVQEREARRARNLELVTSGVVADSDSIQAGLRSPEPNQSTPWAVLGWQEEITHSSSSDGPTLRRQWTPLKQQDKNSATEYP